MDCFSEGSMQSHPLYQGSIFSSSRLHARIISETSHQVSLSLDVWHARHNLNVIKTHQPDTENLIPHINLAALMSHITSRSCWHTQLGCFKVIPLSNYDLCCIYADFFILLHMNIIYLISMNDFCLFDTF